MAASLHQNPFNGVY